MFKNFTTIWKKRKERKKELIDAEKATIIISRFSKLKRKSYSTLPLNTFALVARAQILPLATGLTSGDVP